MRCLAFVMLFAVAADAAQPGATTPPRPPCSLCAEQDATRPEATWPLRETVVQSFARWIGVKNGHWDAFEGRLADSPLAPRLAGTIKGSAAEIQLRWRADE